MIKTQWQLTALSGPTESQTVVLAHKMSLGRAVAADIVVASPDVSRQHASLEVRADNTLWVTDEHSSNGTLINEHRMGTEPQRLNSGDTLQFGQVLFKVVALEVNVADEAPVAASLPVQHLVESDEQVPATTLHTDTTLAANHLMATEANVSPASVHLDHDLEKDVQKETAAHLLATETVVHEAQNNHTDFNPVDVSHALVDEVPAHESSNPVAPIDAAAIAGERILFQIKPDAPTEELLTAQDFHAEPTHHPVMSQASSVVLAEHELEPVASSTTHTEPATTHVETPVHVELSKHDSNLAQPPVTVDTLPHVDTIKTTDSIDGVTALHEPMEHATAESTKPLMPEAIVHSAEPVLTKPISPVEPIAPVIEAQPVVTQAPDVSPVVQPVEPVIEPKPIAEPAPVVPTPNINTKTLPPVAPIQSPASLNAPKVAEAAGLPKGIIITIVFILIILAIVLWLFTGSH